VREAVERARRIEDVVARMKAIIAGLPPDDGVRAFTTLYLAVTQAVASAARKQEFEDVRSLRWLDVAFANLYFDAIRGLGRGTATLRAWAPLVEARGRRGILPLQFALAGMNAHINRDLPVALVQTWEAHATEPRRSSPQRRDFRRVNALLAATEDRVKPQLLDGWVGDVDVALGRADDVLAMWKVEQAREAAWVNGETFWALRGKPQLQAAFLRTLDRSVGFAGRGLLRPL
jgi:hypothetical protein